jgi:dolichol kinase
MSDWLQALSWLMVLGGGLGAAICLHRLGVATTYARDVLHVGAGVWVLGWRFWNSWSWPVAITLAAAIAIPLVPKGSRLRGAVSDEDERWVGLSLYTLAFAVFTFLGGAHRFEAAAALLALSLGDGLGGLVGRRYGRIHFTIPGGKRKSVEGSLTVAVCAALGAWLAGRWLGGELHPIVVGLTAAIAEALAPRSSDNLAVPVAVYAVLRGVA